MRYGLEGNAWTLQSAFDGAALLERPGIEVITVDAQAIREAEAKIAGYERCRPNEAGHPFDCILADVLDMYGPFEFVMSETALCPNCRAELTEKTLVEPQSGIDVETHVLNS